MTVTDSPTRSDSPPFPADPSGLDDWLAWWEQQATAIIQSAMSDLVRSAAESFTGVTAAGDPAAFDDMDDTWRGVVEQQVSPLYADLYREVSLQAVIAAKPPARIAEAMPSVVNQAAVDYSRVATNRIVGAGDSLWRAVRTDLTHALATGATQEELKSTIQSVTRYSEFRADTIARTETMMAYNHGDHDAAVALGEFGPVEKVWIATLDARTRESHADAHDQTVPFGDPFIVGGNAMPFPGSGPPEEVINCRCTTISLYPGDTRPDGSVVGEAAPDAAPEGDAPDMGDPTSFAESSFTAEGVWNGDHGTSWEARSVVQDEVTRVYGAALEPRGMVVDVTANVDKDRISWVADIRTAAGDKVGTMERRVIREADGTTYVEHELFRLKRGFRGQGLAADLDPVNQRFYRSLGATEIRLTTGLDTGGYAWARQGFDWAGHINDVIPTVDNMLNRELRAITNQVESGRITTEVAAQLTRQVEDWRLATFTGNPPTPFEMSELGRSVHPQGVAYDHVGKEAMLGTRWNGVRSL